MNIVYSRDENGYGVKLYLIEDENGTLQIKASKIEEKGEQVLSAPLAVHIAVTNKCNLDCTYCYAKDSMQLQKNDMTLEKLYDVIDQCVSSKVFQISWSGGEPLCKKNFKDILEYVGEKKIRQAIITNGTLISKEYIKVFKKYNISIQMSLNDLYKNGDIIDTNANLIKAKQLSDEGINVIIDVVMDYCIEGKINEIIEACLRNKIYNIKFGPIVSVGKAYQKIDFNKYYNFLKRLLSEIHNATVLYKQMSIKTQFYKVRYGNNFLSRRDLLCEGATTMMYIDNNGDVYPCPLLKSFKRFYCGNISNSTLDSIWHGNEMEKYREISTIDTKCDQCSSVCGVWCRGLTYSYTNDVNGHSPFCSLLTEN